MLSASGLSGAEMCLNSTCPVWVWSRSELCVSAHTGSVSCKRRPLRPRWREHCYWRFMKGRKVRPTQGQEASHWRRGTASLYQLFSASVRLVSLALERSLVSSRPCSRPVTAVGPVVETLWRKSQFPLSAMLLSEPNLSYSLKVYSLC